MDGQLRLRPLPTAWPTHSRAPCPSPATCGEPEGRRPPPGAVSCRLREGKAAPSPASFQALQMWHPHPSWVALMFPLAQPTPLPGLDALLTAPTRGPSGLEGGQKGQAGLGSEWALLGFIPPHPAADGQAKVLREKGAAWTGARLLPP